MKGHSLITIDRLVASAEFWAALAGAFAGAIAAFLLGRLSQWRTSANARRSAGNLTIITLAAMYSEAKAINDSIFLRPLPELTKLHGRAPLYFEFRAAMDLLEEAPPLDIEPLGFLVDSHDPDILARLIAAKNNFAAMLKIAAAHERLSIELQSRLAKIDPIVKAQHRPEENDLFKLVGMDVMLQLKSVAEGLQSILPELEKSLLRLGGELREVLLYQLPWQSFVRFIPEDRGKLSEAKSYAIRPALWRRAIRSVRRRVDKVLGPHWPT